MKKKDKTTRFLVLCLGMLVALNSMGQIELSKEKNKEEEKKIKEEEKKEKLKEGGAEAVFQANWSSTNRVLTENTGLFGKPLGERENEVSFNIWSFGIGFRTQIHEHISWEGGISYLRNGESYLFEAKDTMFQYATTYAYFAMPIKLYYTTGSTFKFYAGGGIVPQLFSGYKQEQKWRTSTNAEESQTITSSKGINTFLLSAVFNAGIQMNMGGDWSLFLMPEYRLQLNSSYLTTEPYKHFGRAIGLNMGLTLQL